MNSTKQNNAPGASRARPIAGLAASIALGAMLSTAAYADMYHPSTNSPGGVPAQSTITSLTTVGTNTTICWYGMQGWYGIEKSIDGGATWTNAGRTAASDFSSCATLDNGGDPSVLFRLNQTNGFAGTGACAGCHGDKHAKWTGTAHSHALLTLQNLHLPAAVEATCQPCHTVGKGQPTGFTDITNTPYLKDVGCENCHGPAAWHKYSDHDLIHPAVSIDPKICGGCHQDIHHPTFEEWSTTLHAEVNHDIRYGVTGGVYYTNAAVVGTNTLYGYYVTTNANLTLKTNATSGILHSSHVPGSPIDPGQDRQVGCGMCHSGATRMAMLKDYEARLTGYTNALNLPTAADSALWGPTCAVCHDPHSADNPGQLRTALWSTNYFTLPTTADKRLSYTTNSVGVVTTNIAYYGTTFATFYDPTIQVCGQCHNSRGARWDGRGFGLVTNSGVVSVGLTTSVSYSRPPHHSPQYNLLSGVVQPDYLNGTSNVFGCHSLNTNGCAACHMATKTLASPSPETPNYTGHEFDPLVPAFVGCTVAGCHDGVTTTVDPTNGLYTLQLETTNTITLLVSNLNNWASLKGTNIFGLTAYNRYLQNAWEYTTPGALAGITNAGPSSADQLKIPVDVRQARFNLYMVSYGKSLGIHNPTYTRYLINDASNKVWTASQP